MAEANGNGRGQLFEYVILWHPKQTKEQLERGEMPKSVLIKEPTRELARSHAEVSILAAREIPTDHLDRLEEIEIVVRPF